MILKQMIIFFLDNSAADSAGGAGIKAAQIIIDHKVDVLLLLSCGQMPQKYLRLPRINNIKLRMELPWTTLKLFK